MTGLSEPPMAAATQEMPCTRLDQYRLLRPIGQGGMGVVHLAVDPDDHLVAIKLLRLPAARDWDARSRLVREVNAMRGVSSPFVTEVTDADLTGEIPYVATRFVPGPTLAEVVAEQGPLRSQALQRLAYGLAEALVAVHAVGIVHRDLKPGNVVMHDGDPVLIDFGIAYQAGDSPLTPTGVRMGTPGYLAPEVIEGQRARTSADVHAWGATVGFAARGAPVYGSGSCEAVFWNILRSHAALDGIHGALYPLVAAALLRQPDERPSAAWLAREVARLDLAVPVPPPTTLWPTPGNRSPATLANPRSGTPAGPEPAYQHPAEVADLLPAVRYRRLRPRSVTPRRPRPHPLLILTALVLAVGASIVVPVAGALAVAALLTLLRAAARARWGLAARRAARGPRARDPFLLAGSMPWALVRSALETLLLAPFLLAAVVAATMAFRGPHILPASAAIAVGYTLLSCLGPGSRLARRELHRVFNVLAPTPLTAAATLLTLVAIATAMATLLLMKEPPLWPLPGLHAIHFHVSV
jgi:hypothetical protein